MKEMRASLIEFIVPKEDFSLSHEIRLLQFLFRRFPPTSRALLN